jgi:amino acid transporter/nucleotide-binding universal stress UspA family protein
MVEHTRTLGFRVAFAIGLGTMIAAGIFSLSGTAVAAIGSSAVIAFVIAALIAGVTAAAYSEFASIYAENGGGYLFASRTFDRNFLMYAVGASLFMGYTGTTAFYLATMDEWFVRFIIPEGWPIPHGTTGVVTALLLGALNARGTEESGMFQMLVTGAKVAVLVAFVAGAFAYQGPGTAAGTFAGSFQVELVGIVSIAALAFITFFGFSAIAASAGEIIEPRETVPKAIAASIVTVTVLYVFVIVAMVNSPISPEVIAEQGETAMGRVAAAFLGPAGQSLIVAGAVFSMVSASNASVLAASGIGSLMGRQGQAPRRFSRIHPEYGTPFWSVATATGVIVALIVLFIAVFPEEGALLGLELGLEALTGFATLNLLAPLAVVNVALVVSRRRFPEIDRPLEVPAVPWIPAVGVVANLALIYNLPRDGAATGVVVVASLLVAYWAWGGTQPAEELYEQVVSPYAPGQASAPTDAEPGSEVLYREESAALPADRPRILVPVARPATASVHVRLAATLGSVRFDDPVIKVVNVTEIPEQTPTELVVEVARERADRLADALAATGVDADYTVEGHICRDIGLDVVQTAREEDVDLVVMGFPEEHHEVAERVEYESPCDVIYSHGVEEPEDVSVVTVGVGGGPHHRALLPLVRALGERGSTIHVVRVNPEGTTGTPEALDETMDALVGVESVEIHQTTAPTVADGLVDVAADHGGPLVIGASRDRGLRRWLFGSTPDRVVERAGDRGVPVVVYASRTTVSGRTEDLLFPVYRYYKQLTRRGSAATGVGGSDQ